MRRFILGACCLCLPGCGGGATGAIAVYVNSQPELATHDAVAAALLVPPMPLATLPAQGIPAAARDAKAYGLASLSFAETRLAGWMASAETRSGVALLPAQHLYDTGATAAWAEGWTGQGQTVAVIDDFSEPLASALRVQVPRALRTPSGSVQTYDVTYEIDFPGPHGQLVANIAGGDADPPTAERAFEARAIAAVPTGCDAGHCTPLPQALVAGLLDQSALWIDYTFMAGIASEAQVVHHHVDLSATQNPDATLAAILASVDAAANASAINLSIGAPFSQLGFDYNSYSAYLAGLPSIRLTQPSDAVIAIAAGNEGAVCGADLIGCNLHAVAGTILPETRANVIVVGATQGEGTAEEIADYSTRAGVLQSRYMVASGQTGMWTSDDLGRSSEIVGTSFAAPRVAGAAAVLRQKFPGLSGAEAASVLLLTASKDINADGVQDFEGTSAIYGQGRLDLAAALSPIGTLALR